MAYSTSTEFGLPVITPELTSEADAELTMVEAAAYNAFISGDECRFRGSKASVCLADVPRRLESHARAHFNELAGTSRLGRFLHAAYVGQAQAIRKCAIA